MTSFFKKYSNSISYTLIFGIFLTILFGFPLGTAAGVIIGLSLGESQKK
ncbi:TPA: hypothetical protein O1375_002454 [Staphylococcus aureus]|nr:hypothetical protein [Staphylococcus aureus]